MIASVAASITDRGLGLPANGALPLAYCGCCTGGTVAVDTPTLVLTPDALVSGFGHGPLVEGVALDLALAGGPVIVCKTTTAAAGTAGSVTRTTGSGALPMTATESGAPRDAYAIRILVTRGGVTLEALTAAVRISIDGGQTYAPEVPVPSSGALVIGDTGVTITFSDATDTLSLQVGDIYSCACVAPTWDATGLGTSLAALAGVAPALDHDGVVVIGDVTDVTAATVKTSHDALLAASKPRWFLCNSRDQNVAGSESVATWVGILTGASPGFTGFTADLMAISAGFCEIDSREIGGIWRRPLSWVLAARLASTPVKEHPGRVRSGALAGIRANGLHHDLAAASMSILDTRRFIGAQTLQGVDGYIGTDRTTAPDGSDFTSIMRVRVICYAARVAMGRMVQEVNEERLVNADGTIDAAEADAIDGAVTSFMVNEICNAAQKRKYCSDVAVSVNRTTNLIATPTLPFRLRIRPLGYSTAITLDLGYALTVRN